MRRDALANGAADKPSIATVLRFYDIHFVDRPGWFAILCPVHNETHPSCTANLDECRFACYACGAHGDVFDLVMAKENCDFQTAKRRVEEITGTGFGHVSERASRVARDDTSDRPGYQPRYQRAVPAGVRFRTGPRV